MRSIFGVVLLGVAALGALALAGPAPVTSVTEVLDDPASQISLAYYLTWSDDDSGVRLTVTANGKTATFPLNLYDWAHWGRVSIYRTSRGNLGILTVSDDELTWGN